MTSSFKSPENRQSRPMGNWTVGEPSEINPGPQFRGEPQFSAPPFDARPLSMDEQEELMRRRRATREMPLDDYSKDRLKILANIGRLTRQAKIEGTTFTLRTLKSKESKDAVSEMFKMTNDLEARHELRRHTLARSLHKIDDEEVSNLLGTDNLQSKLEMFDEMDEALVEAIYREYQELTKEVGKKYSLETEDGIKEVVKDLKK